MAEITPPVDLDELSTLISRCEYLSTGLQVIMTGSGLPEGPERESVCYEIASVIEESAQRAHRLAGALM